jgi:lipopolysaccharide/colanic/teichoic acid biosynthesis glycosyltransferase
MGKRIFDFVVSLFGLILLSPLLVLISLIIKLSSAGPILIRQNAIGKNFKFFHLYRFRTTFINSLRDKRTFVLTNRDSEKFTPIGKVLKKFYLDNLPLLINVLKGEMSLVGPRPELERYVEHFKQDYRFILQVRPGIVDLSSIEFSNESDMLIRSQNPEESYLKSILPKKIKLAKAYVQQQGWILDLKILFTVGTFFLLLLPFPFSKGNFGKKKPLKEVIIKHRRKLLFFLQVGVIVISNYSAFYLRFDGNIPPDYVTLFLKVLPVVLLSRLTAIHYFGLNLGFWRYASIQDLLTLGKAAVVSTVAIWLAVKLFPWTGYPRSIYFIDASMFLLVLGSLRILKRVHAVLTTTLVGARKVLIIGAGNAGEMVARDMLRNPAYNRRPVAFIDDDPKKKLMKIHNIPVVGNTHDLEIAVQSVKPD